jgi:hypothetical protein
MFFFVTVFHFIKRSKQKIGGGRGLREFCGERENFAGFLIL